METRRLGDAGPELSAIGLGSWLTYGGGVGRERTEACTRAAFEAGITFFDTANVYGRGAAERAWGEILSAYPRDSYVLATKVFFPMGPRDRGLSRAQILKQIDASLARLQVDHVDLYQCHRYDDAVPLEETMGALTEVVEAGKARFIGFSEWPVEAIARALELPGVARFVSSQPQYSALYRVPEREVFPLCARHGIGQVVWSPLAQGVLTGKYRRGEPPPADARAAGSMGRFMGRLLRPKALDAVPAPAPDRRRGRPDDVPARAGLGAALAVRHERDRRRLAARAGARERRGRRRAARPTTSSPRSTRRWSASPRARAPERAAGRCVTSGSIRAAAAGARRPRARARRSPPRARAG